MRNGIQLAADKINAVGGLLGRKLEVVRKDDQANPDMGLKMSENTLKPRSRPSAGRCRKPVPGLCSFRF